MFSYFPQNKNYIHDADIAVYIKQISDLLSATEELIEPHDVFLHLLKNYRAENDKSYFNRDHIFRIGIIIRLIEAAKKGPTPSNYTFERIITTQLNLIPVISIKKDGYFLPLLKTFLSFYPHYTALLDTELAVHVTPEFLLFAPVEIIRVAASQLYIHQELDSVIRKTYDFFANTYDQSHGEARSLIFLQQLNAKRSCHILQVLAPHIPKDLWDMIVTGLLKLHMHWEFHNYASDALVCIVDFLPTELAIKTIIELTDMGNNADALQNLEINKSLHSLINKCYGKISPEQIQILLSKFLTRIEPQMEIIIAKLCEIYPSSHLNDYILELQNELDQLPSNPHGVIRILGNLMARIEGIIIKEEIVISIFFWLDHNAPVVSLFTAIALAKHINEINPPSAARAVINRLQEGLNEENIYLRRIARNNLAKVLTLNSRQSIELIVNSLLDEHDFITLNDCISLVDDELKLKIYNASLTQLDAEKFEKIRSLEFISKNIVSMPEAIQKSIINNLFSQLNTSHDEYEAGTAICNTLYQCLSIPEVVSFKEVIDTLTEKCFTLGNHLTHERHSAAIILRKLSPLLDATLKKQLVDQLLKRFAQQKDGEFSYIPWILEAYSSELTNMTNIKLTHAYIDKIKNGNNKSRAMDEMRYLIAIIPKHLKPVLINLALKELEKDSANYAAAHFLTTLAEQISNNPEEYALIPYFVLAYLKKRDMLNTNPRFLHTLDRLSQDSGVAPHIYYNLGQDKDLTKLTMEYYGSSLHP